MSTEKLVSPPGSPAAGAMAPAPTSPSADAPPPGTASPAAAAPQPARPASPPNQTTDPVTALQAAFPSMDRTIISEVLAAHGGNPDSASMALLEISSPTSGGTASRTSGEHTRNAQLMSDEAFARELVAQMEREHMQEYGRPMHSPPGQQQQQQPHRQQEVDYSQLNYEPRQRNRFGQPVGQSTQQSGAGQYSYQQQGQHPDDGRWKHQDELDQLTEQFGKLADSRLAYPPRLYIRGEADIKNASRSWQEDLQLVSKQSKGQVCPSTAAAGLQSTKSRRDVSKQQR